ncbi:ATP-binding protein [Tahibacter amnicola]|uniref:histidine kinase n=1 Tax=Tahibacter amnicola TaxID=2976241 RepID=A0ABY6B9H1_9GAMM|nr:ATP-binding protein [Tahibacter amnicola]UXI66324.1 ATP-binding protein [Tahibacter amnicola]
MSRRPVPASPRRLAALLGLLFAALLVPILVLVRHSVLQLRWETISQYRTLAEELGLRIDTGLQGLVAAEEARSSSAYRFTVLTDTQNLSNFASRAELSDVPPRTALPGVQGYFEVDGDGVFRVPFLPDSTTEAQRWGIATAELAQRLRLRSRLFGIVQGSGRAVALPSGEGIANVATNDDAPGLKHPGITKPASKVQVADLNIGNTFAQGASPMQSQQALPYQQRLKAFAAPRTKRTEQNVVVATGSARSASPVQESELDPFDYVAVPPGHGLLVRKVWQGGRRHLQGALLDVQAFVAATMTAPFQESALGQYSDLVVAFGDDVVHVTPAAQGASERASEGGELLYQLKLSAPFDRFSLLWKVRELPAGPGARVVIGTSVVLVVVMVAGFAGLYRLGRRQLALARQQQDFVAAVSHELKTPLTSIRMYAEILREGWASEAKQREYCGYIFSESERLSRLIASVLQLARMERHDERLRIEPVAMTSALAMVEERVSVAIAQAGFQAEFHLEEECDRVEMAADPDAFVQVMLNLVENALKFAAGGEQRRLVVSGGCDGPERVVWRVRDFGPGVPRSQATRIFELFYRAEDEMTRQTTGTGIGLALVRELVQAMGGEVCVVDAHPGACFEVRLQRSGPA